MTDYLNVILRNYANFSGRARRRAYWGFVGVHTAILAVLFFFTAHSSASATSDTDLVPLGAAFLLLLYLLLSATPLMAVSVRRMHDAGRSGRDFWRLILPNSWLWLLLNLTFDSQPGANRWGPNPKETQALNPLA